MNTTDTMRIRVINRPPAAEPKVQNRGTGAGGANTNLQGKTFEEKTSIEAILLRNGYVKITITGCTGKFDYYFEKVLSATKTIRYFKQGGLKSKTHRLT
jgi:hypothetical protein